jgi:hypothetical protein
VEDPGSGLPEQISVTSRAFGEGDAIPVEFTCDGADDSPPLAWTGAPDDAAAVALLVDDPDAPRGTFVHWVVLDLPPSTTSVGSGEVPAGGVQARNSAGEASYFGPCPPSGTHRYRFTVYALSEPTGLDTGADLDEAVTAIDRLAVARGRLTATYHRAD